MEGHEWATSSGAAVHAAQCWFQRLRQHAKNQCTWNPHHHVDRRLKLRRRTCLLGQGALEERVRGVNNFVLNHNNKDLSGVSFFWFVADRQLHDCLQACSNHGLNYKLLVWHKPGTLANVTGQRFRHNCEFIVCGWVGHERDFVQNIDREDQDRYSTVASIQKTKRFWRNEEGQVVNPYQKTVLLLRKLLVMAQRTTNGLVVDITCGTGTTAVGSLLLPFPG